MTVTTEDFFKAIYGKSHGYVVLVTKSESGAIDSQRWFEYPRDLERNMMQSYVEIRSDEDVYCAVNVFSNRERNKDDASAVANVVYADLDTCHPDHLRLPPTYVVQTSEGHWHGWWVLDEEVSAKDAADASKRIYQAHAAQGCDRGWAIGKLLRVPGTTNTKRATPEFVTVEFIDQLYTLDTINDVYSDIDINPTVKTNNDVPDPIEDLTELEQVVSNNNLTDLYLRVPEEGESWSERAYRLEIDLFRAGLNAVEVFSLVRNAACNKYNPDFAGQRTQTGVLIPKRSNPDLVLWKEVQKAYAEFEQEEPAEEAPQTTTRPTINHEFLTMEERRYCQDNPTFIDHYVAWVADRTDSSPIYQYSAAYMLLASVFAGRGYLPLAWGDTQLNLWVLLLGDTTRTRKSTAKNIMMAIIHEYERQTSNQIDIGSDASPEALRVELGKRDGLSSIMHKDEINGWFASLYSKQYMAGALEQMTELYDGHVPVALRTTKDSGNRNRATTAFSFIGVGIRKRTAEILTRNHFESGFLARMLWAVADPPPRVAGSEDIMFRDDDVDHITTGYMADLVSDLVMRVSRWSTSKPVPVTMDAASLARYNQWAEDGMKRVEALGDDDVVVPSFQRLKTSVAKAAALLALYDQTDVITLKHLLPALAQAEMWFRDMMRMAGEVSASEFERRLDKVEGYIMTGKDSQRSEVDVRKKFPQYRPRDWSEIFDALKGSGRIRNAKDRRGYYEALV